MNIQFGSGVSFSAVPFGTPKPGFTLSGKRLKGGIGDQPARIPTPRQQPPRQIDGNDRAAERQGDASRRLGQDTRRVGPE